MGLRQGRSSHGACLWGTVRPAVTAALPPRAAGVPAVVPFGQQARKALELTVREALRRGRNHIGTGCSLLALSELEDGDGVLTGRGTGTDGTAGTHRRHPGRHQISVIPA